MGGAEAAWGWGREGSGACGRRREVGGERTADAVGAGRRLGARPGVAAGKPRQVESGGAGTLAGPPAVRALLAAVRRPGKRQREGMARPGTARCGSVAVAWPSCAGGNAEEAARQPRKGCAWQRGLGQRSPVAGGQRWGLWQEGLASRELPGGERVY